MISLYTTIRSLLNVLVPQRTTRNVVLACIAVVIFVASMDIKAQQMCEGQGQEWPTRADCDFPSTATQPYTCQYRSSNDTSIVEEREVETGISFSYNEVGQLTPSCGETTSGYPAGQVSLGCSTSTSQGYLIHTHKTTQEGRCANGLWNGSYCELQPTPGCSCDDGEPIEATGSCDREPVKYCESSGTYIAQSATCIVNDCSSATYAQLNPQECGGGTDDGEGEQENNCTGDYYTDPSTREIVCGTYTSTHDNGNVTEVSTSQSGDTTVTTTQTDGTVTETIQYPDGSSNTYVTLPSGSTTSSSSNQNNNQIISGAGNDADCPSNSYTVINLNQVVCKDALPSTTGDGTSTGFATIGSSCDAAPVCSGDQIQCAILYENWNSRCISEENFGEVETDIFGGFVDAGFTETEDSIVRIETSLTDIVFDTAGFLPSSASCAPLGVMTVGAGTPVEFRIDLLCDLADKLGYLLVGFAYFMGARIVLGAL